MRITIVTPAAPGSQSGNRITAQRWARILRGLGHQVAIGSVGSKRTDLLIALHAQKSAGQILNFADSFPDRPIVAAISGTDIYGNLDQSRDGMAALDAANAVVVLEPSALSKLPKRLRAKSHLIRQSATPPSSKLQPLKSCFEVSISGHLRSEKDPFLIAQALEHLPSDSRIRVTHIGGAMSAVMKRKAESFMLKNSRYRWLGEKKHWQAKRLVARSRLSVNSSLMESSSNAVVEAIVSGVPLLASKVPGNVGVFGAGYSGYFPVGNSRKLARLLEQVETDPKFYGEINKHCRTVAKQFTPAREKAAWRKLIATF